MLCKTQEGNAEGSERRASNTPASLVARSSSQRSASLSPVPTLGEDDFSIQVFGP